MLRQRASSSRQRGAILAITAIMLVVLVGIAALALDMGRVLVLRSEMQNAADAAALAGAVELNGKADALDRARVAARDLLEHKGHHAKDAELLGESLQDVGGRFAIEFFCSINSEFDIPDACHGVEVDEDGDGDIDKILAESHVDAKYIRVSLLPDADSGSDSYVVKLFFLPVLSLWGGEFKGEQEVFASAVAGRNFYMCNYPPVMICDPFETDPYGLGVNSFREAVERDSPLVEPGDEILLKLRGPTQSGGKSHWVPGDVGLLYPRVGDDYVDQLKDIVAYIANPCDQGCTPPIIYPKPGQNTGPVNRATNTFFDIYPSGGSKLGDKRAEPEYFPPAPNVIEFPRDDTHQAWDPDSRFGTGDWDWRLYRDTYHRYVAGGTTHYDEGFGPGYDAALAGMTRWEVYNLEISSGYMPRNPFGANNIDEGGAGDDLDPLDPPRRPWTEWTGGNPPSYEDPWACQGSKCPTPKNEPYPVSYLPEGLAEHDHLNLPGEAPTLCEDVAKGGEAAAARSVPERRVLYVAVVQCVANEKKMHKPDVPVDTFAKVFVLRRSGTDVIVEEEEKKTEKEKIDIVTEFLGLAEEEDAHYHVDVQLYE